MFTNFSGTFATTTDVVAVFFVVVISDFLTIVEYRKLLEHGNESLKFCERQRKIERVRERVRVRVKVRARARVRVRVRVRESVREGERV